MNFNPYINSGNDQYVEYNEIKIDDNQTVENISQGSGNRVVELFESTYIQINNDLSNLHIGNDINQSNENVTGKKRKDRSYLFDCIIGEQQIETKKVKGMHSPSLEIGSGNTIHNFVFGGNQGSAPAMAPEKRNSTIVEGLLFRGMGVLDSSRYVDCVFDGTYIFTHPDVVLENCSINGDMTAQDRGLYKDCTVSSVSLNNFTKI